MYYMYMKKSSIWPITYIHALHELVILCVCCCLIQLESQCQSAASVSLANVDCQTLNVTFTCGSIHVNYVLAFLLSQAQATNVSTQCIYDVSI